MSGLGYTVGASSAAGPFGFPYTIDPMIVRGSDSTVLTGGDGWYFRVYDSGNVSKIALEVVTASGNISVAAYRNTGTGQNAAPGTRLATSGAIACPAAGYREISLGATVTITPGDWFAISADNATAAFRCMLNGVASSALGAGRVLVQQTAHPLPSSPASLQARIGNSILMVGVA